MGMGQFIFLDCPCGFRSNRVQIGSLLAHESSLNGYTVIVATFDIVKREILTHSACLPPELDTADDDSDIDDWFNDEHEVVRLQHGPLLTLSSDKSSTTDYPCPDCGRDLQLNTDGSWIA